MKNINRDFCVIGAGLTGICAAIAASRKNISVSLINDRPTVGGNSSSEYRVWVSSAQSGIPDDINFFARETGIIEEILLTNKYRNPEGNPIIWDTILFDFIKREKNIDLFLNTIVNEITKVGDKIIDVKGYQMRSEKKYRFKANYFADCTGDGNIANLAEANFLIGNEGKNKFNESLAPETSNKSTMGNTIFFQTKDVGKKVDFVPPKFAYDPENLHFLKDANRGGHITEKASGCDYWWFEYGGILDTIKNDQKITEELQKLVWGIWDYVKNSGEYNTNTLTVEWVGHLSGKRESRRIVGEYILDQNDIQKNKNFFDAIGHGGWPIDIHPPQGIYSKNPPANQTPVSIYDLPFRTLICKGIDNLYIGGRNFSASRLAFSSTRVMGTCSVMGQAIGTSISLAQKYNCSPKNLLEKNRIKDLQQELLKDDQYIIGQKNQDPNDKAKEADIKTSSEMDFKNKISTMKIRLEEDKGIIIPCREKLENLSLYIKSVQDTSLNLKVYSSLKPENYFPEKLLFKYSVNIPEYSYMQWFDIPLFKEKTSLLKNHNKLFIVLERNNNILFGASSQKLPGIFSFSVEKEKKATNQQGNDIIERGTGSKPGIKRKLIKKCDYNISFDLSPGIKVYSGSNIINGFGRPYREPNIWVSKAVGNEPEYVILDLKQNINLEEVRIYFNSYLNKRIINLKSTNSKVFSQVVKDYNIYARQNDSYKLIKEIRGNYQRFKVHTFISDKINTDNIKIEFLNTNGAKNIQVFEIRIYGC